jgi:hypothetical protein
LPEFTRYALAFSACGTCVSTRYGRIPRFSRAPGMVPTPHTRGPSPFGEVLTITVLPSLNRLGHGDGRAGIVRMRHFAGRRWNINQLPIRWIRLRATLGPANPRLTSIVEEPLPQSAVVILTPLCCYSFHDSRYARGPQDLTALRPPTRYAALPDHLSVRNRIGDMLEPRLFSGPMTSTSDLLRTL